jgi:hypothetical protein
MHKAQKEWCESLRRKFPIYFYTKRVLDIGSLDVNGTNRYLFYNCHYDGVDIIAGKGVDIVCPAHKLTGERYDVVLSTNALEHDMFWFLTLPQMIRLLEPGGLMFFSCAYSRRQHGTRTSKPKDSGTTLRGGDWGYYYRNLRLVDVYPVLQPERSFVSYMIGVAGRDLRFWGIKK